MNKIHGSSNKIHVRVYNTCIISNFVLKSLKIETPLVFSILGKDACAAYVGTKSYMGGIHPRNKKIVGERLALAAMGVARCAAHGGEGRCALHGASGAPTISGCTLSGDSLTIRYNSSLLAGGAVGVKATNGKTTFSAMRVLVDARYWCQDTVLAPVINGRPGRWMCNDPGAPSWRNCGNDVQCGATSTGIGSTLLDSSQPPGGDMPGVWMLVNVAAKSDTEVVLDLSILNGSTPVAVRYAWSNERDSCCESLEPTQACQPAACPIYDKQTGLPGNPFTARIEGGKCVCIPPQVCHN